MSDEAWGPGGNEPGFGEMDDRTVHRPRRTKSAGARLRFDDGTEHSVIGRTFVGRAPEPQPLNLGGALIPIDDATMSVSKTHAMFDVVDGVLEVSDLGSTNGSVVESLEGERTVVPGVATQARPGERVRLGDRWFDVLAAETAAADAPSAAPGTAAADLITAVPPGPGLQPLVTAVQPPAAPAEQSEPVVPAAPARPAEAPAASHAPAPPDAGDGVISTPPPVAANDVALVTCSNCRAPLPAGTQFCTECGMPVPARDLSSGGNRTWMLVAGAAAVVVVVVVVAAIVLLGGGGSSSSAGGYQLVSEPESAFRTDAEIAEFGFAQFAGTVDRLFVVSGSWSESDEGDSLVVALDGEGETRWSESFNGMIDDVASVDGDVLVVVQSGDDGELLRLDGDDGEELWSQGFDDQRMVELDGEVYALDQDLYFGDAGTLERLDSATGESLGRLRLPAGSSPISDLYYGGVVIAWDYEDEEVQVYSSTFEELTEPIDVGEVQSVAFQDGVVAALDDGDLVTFDSAGEQQQDDALDLDEAWTVEAAGGGRWIVSDGEESEAVRFDGDALESLWTEDGRVGAVRAVGGQYYASLSGDDTLVVDVSNGEIVGDHDADEWLEVVGNGYLLNSDGDQEAFRLPGGESMWRQRVGDDERFTLLPDGYIVTSTDEDEVAIEAFR